MINKRRLTALMKQEDGSFTLEASLVFPVLFIALIALLLLSMYAYQMVVVYHAASLASERTAFRWDNSARDPVSGIGPVGQYDGLYWRLTDNGALQELFDYAPSSGSQDKGIGIVVGGKGVSQEEGDSDYLPKRKMRAEAGRIRGPFQGSLRYYGTLEKRVEARLSQPISIPPLEKLMGHSAPGTVSSASIVDPLELIRNVDLIRYYVGKFKGGMNGEQRKQAQSILSGRQAQKHD